MNEFTMEAPTIDPKLNAKLTDYVLSDLLGDVIDWMRDNLEPEDVFTEAQLLTWAYDNGLTESEGDE